jgi:hypothetical protein
MMQDRGSLEWCHIPPVVTFAVKKSAFDGRHSYWRLRLDPAGQYRHRTWRYRRGGGGYTYFNPQTGRELSAVTGLTYNFTNPSTDYRNGVDWRSDWGMSQFLSKQVHVSRVGYFYQPLSGDSGGRLGDFKSRVFGIGPQIGYIFPVGNMQGYLNLKGYKEFDEAHRAAGWNGWGTFAISPAAPSPPAPTTPRIHK